MDTHCVITQPGRKTLHGYTLCSHLTRKDWADTPCVVVQSRRQILHVDTHCVSVHVSPESVYSLVRPRSFFQAYAQRYHDDWLQRHRFTPSALARAISACASSISGSDSRCIGAQRHSIAETIRERYPRRSNGGPSPPKELFRPEEMYGYFLTQNLQQSSGSDTSGINVRSIKHWPRSFETSVPIHR